jgi:hypothetical protein
VIDEIGGFRRLARFPFWMRPGYVEELYEPTSRNQRGRALKWLNVRRQGF